MADQFFFVRFEQYVSSQYPQLFGKDTGGSSKGTGKDLSGWGWYNTIYTAINGEIYQIDRVKQQNFYEVMAYCSYKRDITDES